MNALNRAIFREIMAGNIKFDTYERFADIGSIQLCRQVLNNRWHLLITSGNQVKLGVINQIALRISAIYYAKEQHRNDDAK